MIGAYVAGLVVVAACVCVVAVLGPAAREVLRELANRFWWVWVVYSLVLGSIWGVLAATGLRP